MSEKIKKIHMQPANKKGEKRGNNVSTKKQMTP